MATDTHTHTHTQSFQLLGHGTRRAAPTRREGARRGATLEHPSGRAGHWFRCRQPPKTATRPMEGRPSERKGRKEGREQERRTRSHTGTNEAASNGCCTAAEGSSGQGLAECQLEDGRHDPLPPYLRPEVPTSPNAASKPSKPRTGLNDPSSAPPEPDAALVPNLPVPRCLSTV